MMRVLPWQACIAAGGQAYIHLIEHDEALDTHYLILL